jgi:hypothetical protein
MEIGKGKNSPLINADNTDRKWDPGVESCKPFRILVDVEGGGVSKSKGFLLLLNEVWNRAADYT